MHIMFFTERPYRDVPEDEVIKNRSFFGVPNLFYDAQVGARLYNEYLDEDVYAEEVGFDGIMLNEHHGNPFCMGAVMNVEAAILARITKKARIVLLGNPLPVVKNPVRPSGFRASSAPKRWSGARSISTRTSDWAPRCNRPSNCGISTVRPPRR